MINQISCGIVVYDEVSDIKRLVLRIKNELSDYSIEWIFILNHEQAEIRQWIKTWIEENLKATICIENPSNNLGYARQLILESATEDYIYMTDPDVEIKSGSIKKLLQLAEVEAVIDQEMKYIGFGGTLIYQSNNLFLQKTFDFISKVARQIPFSFQIQHHLHLSTVDHIPSCHLLLKRTLALEIGGFSNLFSKVGEDLDFSHRAFNAGYRFVFSPHSEAYHYQNITLGKWLSRVFSFGQVQITVQKLHFNHGLRYYRLLPGAILVAIGLFSFFFSQLALILMLIFLLIGIAVPGFLGFLFTALTYSCGEIVETIYPLLELKNAKELQEAKSLLDREVQRSKI